MQYAPEPQGEEAAVLLAVGLVAVFLWAIFRHFYKGNIAFVNFFKKVVPLSSGEKIFLAEFIAPYNNFSATQRDQFVKRLQWLKTKKRFIFYGDVAGQEEIKLSVCAAMCLLTFGFNRFQLVQSVARVVVYPSKYYSKIRRAHHLGEYNPKLKTLVFSADSLKEGFRIPSDNKNLALHEIAHALCFETKGGTSWQSKKFQVGFRILSNSLYDADFRNQLKTDGYIREYGLQNPFEFFAVLTENFVESPERLKAKYPKLYEIVRVMYGFDFQDPNWKIDIKNSMKI